MKEKKKHTEMHYYVHAVLQNREDVVRVSPEWTDDVFRHENACS